MIDPLSIGLGIAGLGAQIFGAVKGGKANRENQRLLDEERENAEARYDQSKNFFETAAAKGQEEMIRKNQLEANKQAEQRAAVTGGTPEAEIAAKAAIQDKANDAMNQLGQQATGYQERAENQYVAEKNAINQQQMAINAQKAQNAQNVAGNAGNLLNAAGFMEALKDKANPLAGLNK